MTYSNFKSYLGAGLLCCLLFITACRREGISKQKPGAAARAAQRGGLVVNSPSCGDPIDEHIISLAYAHQLVDNYRIASRIPDKVCQLYDQGGWVISETFPAAAIQAILSQANVCAFRIYNGIDVDNRQHLVLVGVDHNGFDALSRNAGNGGKAPSGITESSDDDPGLIIEMGAPCPRACRGVYQGS